VDSRPIVIITIKIIIGHEYKGGIVWGVESTSGSRKWKRRGILEGEEN
jgi:hypothetical protein